MVSSVYNGSDLPSSSSFPGITQLLGLGFDGDISLKLVFFVVSFSVCLARRLYICSPLLQNEGFLMKAK